MGNLHFLQSANFGSTERKLRILHYEIIRVNEILFTGKQNIKWKDVEKYLKKFAGMSFTVKEYSDVLYINSTFANEYAGSRYTKKLRGSLAKTKANIVQVLPQLVQNATNRCWVENKKEKHTNDAVRGWYRYDTYFSIPVCAENEDKSRWNSFSAEIVVRINDQGLYLYDIVNIKKEARKPTES